MKNFIKKLFGITCEQNVTSTLTITIGKVSYSATGKSLEECKETIFECMQTIKTKPVDYIE